MRVYIPILILALGLGGCGSNSDTQVGGLAADASSRSFVFPAGETDPPAGFFRRAPVEVDFDHAADGSEVPHNSRITDQYLALGVKFSADGRARTISSGRSNFAQDAISQPNSLALESHTELLVEFDGRCPTAVGIVFTDSAPNNPFTITAFNAQGHAVAAESIDTADFSHASQDGAEDTFVGVRYGAGMAAVRLSVSKLSGDGIRGWEVDDLRFGDFHATARCTAGSGAMASSDADGDQVADSRDNCPTVFNDQRDSDGDGRGDACDPLTQTACGLLPGLVPLVQPQATATEMVAASCLSCAVHDPDHVVDFDPESYALLAPSLGVQGSVSLLVADDGAVYPGTGQAGFVVSRTPGLVSAELLHSLVVTSYMNGELRESADGADAPLALDVLEMFGSPDRFFVGFAASQPFNQLELSYGGLVQLLPQLEVFGACAEPPPDVNAGGADQSGPAPDSPPGSPGQTPAGDQPGSGEPEGGAGGAVYQEPELVRAVAPVYPRRALSRGIEGDCLVEYTVTTEGTTIDVVAVDCEPPGYFERSSISAAKQFEYRPGRVNGRPVNVHGRRYLFQYRIEESH